jgi:hypothetical protein
MLKENKLLFLLLIILFSFYAEANDRALALVRKIQGVELLPDSLARQLQTITLQVITKQPDYELLLSGTDTPTGSVVNIVAVESEVARMGSTYRIETRLLNLKTKRLMTKASRENIREEDLIRLFQGALESLFIPDKEKEKEKAIQDPISSPPITPRTQQPQPSTTQTSQPEQPTLDFRQRVLQLKSEADHGIKVVEEKKQSESNPTNNNNNQSSPTNLAKFDGTSSVEAPFENPVNSKVYPKTYDVFFGYDSRQVESIYYVGTTTKVQLMTAKAQGHIPLSLMDGGIAASFDIAYSKSIQSPVALPSIYQAGLYATRLAPKWNASLGFHRDASFFVNLPSPGEGLQPQSISTTWIRAKTNFLLDIKGRWKIGVAYSVPGAVETNYRPLQKATSWQGANMQFSITPPMVIKDWESNLIVEKINLTTSGESSFTLNESRIALSVRRSL